jgi:hypothetical protein
MSTTKLMSTCGCTLPSPTLHNIGHAHIGHAHIGSCVCSGAATTHLARGTKGDLLPVGRHVCVCVHVVVGSTPTRDIFAARGRLMAGGYDRKQTDQRMPAQMPSLLEFPCSGRLQPIAACECEGYPSSETLLAKSGPSPFHKAHPARVSIAEIASTAD